MFVVVGTVGAANRDVCQEIYEVTKFKKKDKLEELIQDPSSGEYKFCLFFPPIYFLFTVAYVLVMRYICVWLFLQGSSMP